MRRLLVSLLALAAVPATAAPRHHHGMRHHTRSGAAGFPILAQPDSVRINAVGQVISKPAPVIQKERNFDARAKHELPPPLPAPQPAIKP